MASLQQNDPESPSWTERVEPAEAPETDKKKRRPRRRTRAKDGPEPVDIHVGMRLRLRRTLLGFSQTELGEALGLTFQQIQKYERGVNRVSASTLHRMASVLSVPVSFFFDDMPADLELPCPAGKEYDITRRETLELLRNYYSVSDFTRKLIYNLIKSIKESEIDNNQKPGHA
jgi:Predicted transcriptional regulators